MSTLFKVKFACVTLAGTLGYIPVLVGAAPLNRQQPHSEVASQPAAGLAPYLQLHYEAETERLLGFKPVSKHTVQASVVGLPCLPKNRGAKHG